MAKVLRSKYGGPSAHIAYVRADHSRTTRASPDANVYLSPPAYSSVVTMSDNNSPGTVPVNDALVGKRGYTREDYLADRCTHREYYAQFVTEEMKARLLRYLGIERLLASKDEHLNDIPLRTWDLFIAYPLAISLKSVGDYSTIAGNVCIAKEAARQLIEAEKKK